MASVGHITPEKAKEYVENQKAHHAKSISNAGIPTIYGWGGGQILYVHIMNYDDNR